MHIYVSNTMHVLILWNVIICFLYALSWGKQPKGFYTKTLKLVLLKIRWETKTDTKAGWMATGEGQERERERRHVVSSPFRQPRPHTSRSIRRACRRTPPGVRSVREGCRLRLPGARFAPKFFFIKSTKRRRREESWTGATKGNHPREAEEKKKKREWYWTRWGR